jgi:hypothetical protein
MFVAPRVDRVGSPVTCARFACLCLLCLCLLCLPVPALPVRVRVPVPVPVPDLPVCVPALPVRVHVYFVYVVCAQYGSCWNQAPELAIQQGNLKLHMNRYGDAYCNTLTLTRTLTRHQLKSRIVSTRLSSLSPGLLYIAPHLD